MRSKPMITFSNVECNAFGEGTIALKVNPGRVYLPLPYKTIYQDILDLKVQESDVWLCSFPRTGCTWASEMIWLIGHNLDYDGAKIQLWERFRRVERSIIPYKFRSQPNDEEKSAQGNYLDKVKELSNPRYITSHLPWHLLPVDFESEDGSIKPKVIYTLRHPKDVVVSYYHYFKLMFNPNVDFESFCESFMKDCLPITPYWNHVLDFWRRRDDPNIHFIKYNEMKRDLPSVIRKTANYLEKNISDKEVENLCEHLNIQNMTTNKAVNFTTIVEKCFGTNYLESVDYKFIRKGQIGDWKNFMSDDLSQKFDDWVELHMKGTGLSFD